jgi:[ribosomal protein S18]-alanine N-acetyltransferase
MTNHPLLPNLEITHIQKRDLQMVMEIEHQSFTTPWSESTFRRGIQRKNPHDYFFVVRHDDVPIAYINFWLVEDEAHIANFAVSPAYRRRGIGKYLFINSLAYIRANGGRKVTLEVRASNIPAQNLYRQFGFHPVAIRKEYYVDNGEDAYIFCVDDLSAIELRVDNG